MNDVFSKFGVSGNGDARKAIELFDDPMCPLMSQLMLGQNDPDTGRCVIPKFKLTVWREGNRYKACFGPGKAFRRFFHTSETLEALCEQIEDRLTGKPEQWVDPATR